MWSSYSFYLCLAQYYISQLPVKGIYMDINMKTYICVFVCVYTYMYLISQGILLVSFHYPAWDIHINTYNWYSMVFGIWLAEKKKNLSHWNNCLQYTHFNDGVQSCIIYNTWQISAFPLVISSFLVITVRAHGISPLSSCQAPITSQKKKKFVEWSCLDVSNFPFQFLGL